MAFLVVLGIVLVAACLSRLIRQAEITHPLRHFLSDRSALLAKLLHCPHCLSFWIALGCTAALWALRGASLLEFGLFTLLGWRGGYYLNQALDRRQQSSAAVTQRSECPVCGKPVGTEPVERRGAYYCSSECWIEFLRTQPVPREKLIGPKGEILRQEIYPLSYKDVTCAEAQQLLDSDEGYAYLDVRSEPEFGNGHPAGAHNIPVMHREAIGLVPNPDFLTVVQAHFPRDTRLLVGCHSGVRSVRAVEALLASGYTDVSNVSGGFGGARTHDGQVVHESWLRLGLPVHYGDAKDRSYGALRGRR